MLALLVSASAFTAPLAPMPAAGCMRAATPCASLSSRRAALAGASFAALAAVAPLKAGAESSEDAIARIAAKNKAALDAEREAKKVKLEANRCKVEKENAGSTVIVGAIGAASLVFSFPFFYKNLARLFLRYRSVVDKSIDASQYDKNYQ